MLNKNNIEVKNRLNSVDEKAKEILDKALHLLLSKRIKGRLCVPYDLISKDVRPEARRRKYKKNLILQYNTAVSKPVKTGMPEEAKKAEADKKRRKNLCSGKIS